MFGAGADGRGQYLPVSHGWHSYSTMAYKQMFYPAPQLPMQSAYYAVYGGPPPMMGSEEVQAMYPFPCRQWWVL